MPLLDWDEFAASFVDFEEKTGNLTSVGKALPDVNVLDIPAIRGAVTSEMLAETDGAAVRPSASYQIRRSQLDVQPKPGDLWDEGGETYRVQVVQWDDEFWLLGVYNPKIDANLRDLCSVYTAAEGETDAGTRYVPSRVATFSNLLCRVQMVGSEPAEPHKKYGMLDTFDIYFDDNYAIFPDVHTIYFTHPFRNVSVHGDVVEVANMGRIGDLMTVRVEVRP